MIAHVRRMLQRMLVRAPRLRSHAFVLLDLAVSPALLLFRLERPPSNPAGTTAVEDKTDEFNRAAERYYSEHSDPKQLLEKPFSEPDAVLSRRLIDVGVLMDGLRILPGDTVLELGAGSCWLSHILNKFGCRTIAVDVSPSALAIGQEAFRRDPQTNWQLEPRFLSYEGRRLPVPDASVDRIILHDAYHHLPNAAQMMREMRRVLRSDGIVGMSEPGRGHAASRPSQAEAAATGVLENEIVLEDVAELALSCGFVSARVIIANRPPMFEIDASDLRRFMGGRGFSQYWRALTASLDGHHFILLFAGDPVPTTRRPRLLRARFGPPSLVRMEVGRSAHLTLTVQNAGDTRWLSAADTAGWTRLGAHLYRVDQKDRIEVDFDWLRVAMPGDVEPDEVVSLAIELPPIDEPGEYLVAFDLVIEGIAWFADRGSMPVEIPCRVV